MRILLVNDDGFGSEGIILAESILKEYGEVFVCAPKTHQSAKGASLFLAKKYQYEKKDDHHFVIDGTPVMCTIFGLSHFNNIDLVVSGCNYGLNASLDIFYSGTVGACIEALNMDVPAISLSADLDFSIVKNELRHVLDFIFRNKLHEYKNILNVNFPNVIKSKGIKIASTHKAHVNYNLILEDENTFSYSRYGQFDDPLSNSDIELLKEGYITISPLINSVLDVNLYNKLKDN